MFQIQTGKAPSYLQDLVPSPVQARTRYNLRNSTDIQQPFARLETYAQSYFPAAVRLWNSLPPLTRQANSKNSFKSRYLNYRPRPTTNSLYYYGQRTISVFHARMRIRCSLLKDDLCSNLHVIPSPNCQCLLSVPETPEHYFLKCPFYILERRELLHNLLLIPNISSISDRILLYGDSTLDDQSNLLIYKHVHHFISQTNRFRIYNT